MWYGCRTLSLLLAGSAVLSGCGSSSTSIVRGSTVAAPAGTGSGSATTTTTQTPVGSFGGATTVTGTINAIVATPSVSGTLSVTAGATQTVSVTFTSNDGLPITGFGISASLGTLPTGWTGPSTFACALVAVGSDCVLNLTYTPTAATSGSLSIDYVFIDNASFSRTGETLIVPYTATQPDNVFATVAPTGQINAVIGKGPTPVLVNFATDDENVATALNITTDLSMLPAGWSSNAPNFSCAIVTTGNGCQLMLNFAPSAAARGTLQLAYSYLDDTGAPKSSTINLAYATAAAGTVIATAAPTGEVNAAKTTGKQSVAVTFNTDDGQPASGLFVATDLSKLPSGWSASANSFACASISTGNGCQLRLSYAPTALGGGNLGLNFGYTDAGGAARMGTLDIPYTATTNDNVTATPLPSGQINAVVGMGSQSVSVTFATDDARPATALSVTSDLGTLPAGWSATTTTFACAGVSSGAACNLGLTYAPTVAGSGTLMLNYAYKNNANDAKVGTLTISYRATTDDQVVGTPNQGSLSVRSGSRNSVNVVFATDDGNPASAMLMTTDLSTLPAGWAAAQATFSCASVSAAAPCILPLTYDPTVADAGTLALGFSYLNDSGFARTGTVNVAYTAITPYLYVANANASKVSSCPLNADDSVLTCGSTGSTFAQPSGISFLGNRAYIANQGGNSVSVCGAGNGALHSCSIDPTAFNAPTSIAADTPASLLYVAQDGALSVCTASAASGALSNCAPATSAVASASVDSASGVVLSADASHAYAVHARLLQVCSVGSNGMLNGCSASGTGAAPAAAVLGLNNGVLYAAALTGGVLSCRIEADASLGACQTSASGTTAYGIGFSDSTAYVSTGSASLWVCDVATDGSMTNCSTFNDPSFSATSGLAVR